MKQFCLKVPQLVIYIYETWQPQLALMEQEGLVNTWIKGGDDIEEQIQAKLLSNQPKLVIFDGEIM